MNASAEDDRPSQGKKHTLNRIEERAVRCLLFLSALVFYALATALTIFLCAGTWSKSGLRSPKAIKNSESHLVTMRPDPTIASSKPALITYIVFMIFTVCVWLWNFLVRMIKHALDRYRIMAASHTLAAAALLAASTLTMMAACVAAGMLTKYESVFNYHSVGNPKLVITWVASVSHLLAETAYVTSVVNGQRLRKPELYPSEPEPEPRRLEEFVRAGARARRAEATRSRVGCIREEHQSKDAYADRRLPSYSRVDPYALRASVRGETKPDDASGPPMEMRDLRPATGNQSRADNLDVPAPDYEQHQIASGRGP
ncbi:hypothetical protein CORC01_11071 [Colletotrichum orchidophilum]|uniref:Uncharacterized protein n=1 Tax=Colletotrichum orchidophilum TaxID=1209926 RepID=A0A1G4AWX3_9PEZI|nr:uncharacterized protein CORC01_11071 [Colletotrichum orchidophilum]OHE93668.1 hypothetical protein CORC01_11071 [Colletotrichum orchidophilum]